MKSLKYLRLLFGIDLGLFVIAVVLALFHQLTAVIVAFSLFGALLIYLFTVLLIEGWK